MTEVTVTAPVVTAPAAKATGCPCMRHARREWSLPGGLMACGVCHPAAVPGALWLNTSSGGEVAQ